MVPDLEGDAPGTLRPYSPKKLFENLVDIIAVNLLDLES